MNRQSEAEIRRLTFEAEEETGNEKGVSESAEQQAAANTEKSEKANSQSNKEAANRQKPSVMQKLKQVLLKEKQEEIPELWTGQTSVLDILAPSSVDNGSRDYIVVDGVYHTYLYVAGYGYRTKNEGAWLSPLVEAGDNIGISFTFKKMPRDKILSRISQKTMLNRSRMREVGDTRQDYEELDSAISSGFWLKEGINRTGQDFYYMTTVIEVTADDEEELEIRVNDVITLCASMSMSVKRADYKHEQCFLSALPTLSLDADMERKGRRNVLTDSLAAAFPFSSFEIYDPNGIFLGAEQVQQLHCHSGYF